MEYLPKAKEDEKGTPIWKNSAAWLREKRLNRDFWVFFTAAFFFDFGFAVYYFLFNLYLLDLHFDERAIGLIGGASTLGSVVGTLPAGFLARKFGIRPLLTVCFVAAPIMGVLRAMAVWEPMQIGLGFLSGVAMCLWGVCFLPVIARSTTEENRASAFGLIFSVSIGTSTLGGVVCGYLPTWLKMAGIAVQPVELKRLILVIASVIAAVGLIAVLKMRLVETQAEASETSRRPLWKLDPFLLRFLPAMALWTAVLASFTPFANVYLSRDLHISLASIGLVFSTAQIVQFCIGLLTPLIFRALGLVNGIVATQIGTAAVLACLAATHDTRLAIALYLGFSAMQWMSSPGLYNLVMSKVPDEERSTASAMTMFCNAVMSSISTAGAGILFARFGYPRALAGIALLALVAGLVFRLFIGSTSAASSAVDEGANPVQP